MFERGKIVLVPFPFTDLSAQKIRPALIISQPKFALDTITVVFISSVVPKRPSPTELIIQKSALFFKHTGLKVDSIIRCHKIVTLDKKIILGEIGALPKSQQIIVDKKIKLALGLR